MSTNLMERREKLVTLIIAYWQKLDQKQGRRTSSNELARHFGVSPTSMSNWINKMRDPSETNMHLLAAKLGPEVYDIFDVPARIPDDPITRALINIIYDENFPAELRPQVVAFAKSLVPSLTKEELNPDKDKS